jgi:hypothetical protein
MRQTIQILGVAAFGIALGLSCAADAQTARRHVHHITPEGHVIVVHPRESFLTAGTGASFGEFNSYALDTFRVPGQFMPAVDNTFVGVRGLDRMPNNFTVPGCCFP